MSYNKSEKGGWNYDRSEGKYSRQERARGGTKYVCDCPEDMSGKGRTTEPSQREKPFSERRYNESAPQQTAAPHQPSMPQQTDAPQEGQKTVNVMRIIFFILMLLGIIKSCT